MVTIELNLSELLDLLIALEARIARNEGRIAANAMLEDEYSGRGLELEIESCRELHAKLTAAGVATGVRI